jgi:hypothetical protein
MTSSTPIADLRQSYERAQLDGMASLQTLFQQWLDEAPCRENPRQC